MRLLLNLSKSALLGALDPDPKAIANGLYTSHPLQSTCSLCYSQSPGSWSSWTP